MPIISAIGKDFTRERVLSFAKVVILILSGHKFSLQNAVNKFFSRLGKVFSTPTASAYCQAKQKVKAEVFVHLNKVLTTDFYKLYVTTLTNREKYQAKEFYQVYGWRWKDETYYDRIKNVFEIERFSGQSEESVKQDFYGVIFLAGLESIISREVEKEIKEVAVERKTAAERQVNHAVSYIALIERVGSLLADKQKNVEEVLKELEHLFRQNLTRKREGRKYPREVITPARKLKYHRYTKRTIA